MGDDQLDSALDLMRRLPPKAIEDNLAGLIDLVPDLTEDLLSTVDQPLKIAKDSSTNRDYLLCDYNRDGDSYRSPWSNQYNPAISGGAAPSAKLREVEVKMNDVMDIYRDLYYEGGVSSAYCWDVDGGFAACILFKKTQDQSKVNQPMKGTWDSIHVVEVNEPNTYKLTSTVMLFIETESEATGTVSLAGSLTRQEEKDFPVDAVNTHLVNIGRMLEDMEGKIRTALELIYFGKTKEVYNSVRSWVSSDEERRRGALTNEMAGALAGRGGPKE